MHSQTKEQNKVGQNLSIAVLLSVAAFIAVPAQAQTVAPECYRELKADVVAFDMPLMFNRMGAQNINGMMYALRRDVVDKSDLKPIGGGGSPGNVTLRPDKRPRPLTLRMGQGDCMTITLTNLLTPVANPFEVGGGAAKDELTNCSAGSPPQAGQVRSGMPFTCEINDQVAARQISLHFKGVELVPVGGKTGIESDGANVGANPVSSLVPVGESRTYKIYAREQGQFIGNSMGGVVGGEGLGGQMASGLFAALSVAPRGAVFYRSSVSNEDMMLALDKSGDHPSGFNEDEYPIFDYEATYPVQSPWVEEGKVVVAEGVGLPVLNMYRQIAGGVFEVVHTELDAMVAWGGKSMQFDSRGPDPSRAGAIGNPWYDQPGHFPVESYPLEAAGKRNPTVPSRLEPFREFMVIFHDEVSTTQAFPGWFEDPVFSHTLHGVRDAFMINYGSGGIGSEIIANRLGVGPMHDCTNCAYEEFFLTFHAVGEVGQLTDIPANFGLENCGPSLDPAKCGAVGPKANFVLYPDDPSNVHHTYVSDQVAFRNLHAGPGENHVFHLHNHQWLWNADDDNSNYLDAQGLGPGAGYGYWMNFSGSGNRNKTAGDAIFHCHFYPHFAQGMWEMWRIHDALELGTELAVTDEDGGHDAFNAPGPSFGLGLGNGTPAPGARALPDGEIVAGVPTPAVIPLMGKPMAPMPGRVTVKPNDDYSIKVCLVEGTRVSRLPNGLCPDDSYETPGPTGSLANVIDRDRNPGYPFWIAGMEHTVGNRPPTPPLDMLSTKQAKDLYDEDSELWSHPGLATPEVNGVPVIDGWDGGLPRFTVRGLSAGSKVATAQTRLDMSKEVHEAHPVFFPETGTDLEQVAMAFHAQRCHDTYRPDGSLAKCEPSSAGNGYIERGGFVTNGAKPIPGAPFYEPCIDDRGRLMNGDVGSFFGGTLTRLWDTTGMTVQGKSPHNASHPRYYKAANVQFDAVFNKLGYHFPQQRIIALWEDVVPTIKQQRPPEPMVLRLNTFDCTQYVHSNVVPKAYELDDYQVRTPTDIIGQHIHLPKWDLVSADGSANGWNYEDGTLSPEAVVEMITAINKFNEDRSDPVTTDYMGHEVVDSDEHSLTDTGVLKKSNHPFFGKTEFKDRWVGARSTMQRWFADPVANVTGVDRGLGIIFTHDHFGPSTHQQVGLYATVLIEPAGSKWVHNETGVQLGLSADGSSPAGRKDGGPTSWQAAILTGSAGFGSAYSQNVSAEKIVPHREFFFEYSDFQHAYQPGVFVGVGPDGEPLHQYDGRDDNHDGLIDAPLVSAPSGLRDGEGLAAAETFRHAIQPPVRLQASLHTDDQFPVDVWDFPPDCHSEAMAEGAVSPPRPCPEAITADDPGMYVVNYRNEPLAARIYDPNRACPDGRNGCQANGRKGDLAFALSSTVNRAIPALNTKLGLAPAGYAGGTCDGGVFCPPINDLSQVGDRDPFTPMVRANDGDHVKIKMQAGGQEEEHTAVLQGLSWLQAGSGFGEDKNSGWRNAQAGGISEQFTLRTPIFADNQQRGQTADYAYSMNASIDGWSSGVWGLIRSAKRASNLFPLPNNDPRQSLNITNKSDFSGVCPITAPKVSYDITAVAANDVFAPTAGVTVQDLFPHAHVGASPNGGGTLVYNPRATVIPGGVAEGDAAVVRGGQGPLHDPTGMLYVNTSDLVAVNKDGHQVIEKLVKGRKGSTTKQWQLWGNVNGKYSYIRTMTAADWSTVDAHCYTNTNGVIEYDPKNAACPVQLRGDVAIEPVVIRAAAGNCINVTVRNKLLSPGTYTAADSRVYTVYEGTTFESPAFSAADADEGEVVTYTADLNGDGVLDPATETVPAASIKWDQTLDLATGGAIPAVVRRDPGLSGQSMTSFQTNMMQPSATVGLQPALVEYDITRSDGMNVGLNPSGSTVRPGGQSTFKWYAGKIDLVPTTGRSGRRNVKIAYQPIEFGGFNLVPADKLEQGVKGLIGAGVIYPQGSTWTVDAGRTTAATVKSSGSFLFRDFTTIGGKGTSLFYKDSYPVENVLGQGAFSVAEDSQDQGHMHINYGNEALWFRHAKNPAVAGGNALCLDDCMGAIDSEEAANTYHDSLAGSPPETAVFSVRAGDPFRMHLLMPVAPGRGSTFELHGHVWQRDPYLCTGDSDLGIAGKCAMNGGLPGSQVGTETKFGSRNLGRNPVGMFIGAQESWFAGQHYELVIPSAGGAWKSSGDYLFRDHMGLGNTGGLWGIVRATPGIPPEQK